MYQREDRHLSVFYLRVVAIQDFQYHFKGYTSLFDIYPNYELEIKPSRSNCMWNCDYIKKGRTKYFENYICKQFYYKDR